MIMTVHFVWQLDNANSSNTLWWYIAKIHLSLHVTFQLFLKGIDSLWWDPSCHDAIDIPGTAIAPFGAATGHRSDLDIDRALRSGLLEQGKAFYGNMQPSNGLCGPMACNAGTVPIWLSSTARAWSWERRDEIEADRCLDAAVSGYNGWGDREFSLYSVVICWSMSYPLSIVVSPMFNMFTGN